MSILRCILVSLAVLAGLLGQAQWPKVSSGKLVRIENFASQYVTQRHVDIWLPEGYSKDKKYAVLYMHDGQMLYDADLSWNKQCWEVDETMGRLTKEGKFKDCIVVGVWNGVSTRHADYFPQRPFMALPANFRDSLLNFGRRMNETPLFNIGINSDNYLKFLVTELKPFIDSAYATLRDAANTFIAGSSMGGLISLYAICEYPKIFGGAACLSTHWPGIFTVDNNPIPSAFLGYMDAQLPSPKTHRIYFDYGTATLDSLYKPFQMAADAVMIKHKYTTSQWMTREFPGEDHSEKAWSKRLDIPLLFLLKK